MESENSTTKKGIPLGTKQNIFRYSVRYCYLEKTPEHKIGWCELGLFKTYDVIAKATGIDAETCKAIANNRCQKCYPQIKITKLPWKEEKEQQNIARKKAIADRIAANKTKKLAKKKMVVPIENIIICDPI
jgi:hypothetical protein